MKFGLFLALLVLLASTNVFGQQRTRTKGRKHHTTQIKTNELEGDQLDTGSNTVDAIKDTQHVDQTVSNTDGLHDENKSATVIHEETKPVTVVHESEPATVVQGVSKQTVVEGDTKPVTLVEGVKKTTTIVEGVPKTTTIVEGDTKPVTLVEGVQKTTTIVEGVPKSTTIVESVPKSTTILQGVPKSTTTVEEAPKSTTIVEEAPKSTTIVEEAPNSTTIVEDAPKSTTRVEDVPKSTTIVEGAPKSTTIVEDVPKATTIVEGVTKSTTLVQGDVQRNPGKLLRKPTDRSTVREQVRPNTEEVDQTLDDHHETLENVTPNGEQINGKPEDHIEQHEDVHPGEEHIDNKPIDHDELHETITPVDELHENITPMDELHETITSVDELHETTTLVDEDQSDSESASVEEGKDEKPVPNVDQVSEKSVHVSGNIVLIKYRSSVVDSVQYDLDGTHLPNFGLQSSQSRSPYVQDFISRQSRVILYVSTLKTMDRKLAFAQFPIQYKEDHFPLSFDINVDLPSQQLGLLERADITLYFFVYITNLETRIDTFLPAGTSQILLQGTNRLVQKLDVYVRASGIEVNGLFRGRFGQRYIRPGTSFQVFIVPEQSLLLRNSPSFEFVAQSILNNVPAMFPVPFSLLVHHQMLKSNMKYYAIGYVFENGIRHSINQEPILVVNEQKSLVTPQIVFTVVPTPFILRGSVTRSMPGSFFLQPHSSLILRLHEIGSDARDIIFKLPEIITLPQIFQVNISQAIRFDPSKNYDMRALITDEKNNIYMASLQPIPLLDEFSKLIIPVDDLLYYVQTRLQSSSNQPLNYIPGSTAQVFVTDSPETPTKPIVSMRIDSLGQDFREFSIQVPATAIQRGRNYYLVMMIESNGIITHVSKTLLISNNQPPPLVIQLPVLSLNLLSGVIFDIDNRPAQWSSSSYANLFLLDDKADNPEKSIIQVWKIHLENDFPVRFEVQLDFSRLHPDRIYRLQGAIENGRSLLEYKPAGSVLALNPNGGIISDVRIPVHNVKTFQFVRGLIYINDLRGPLPDKSEIIVQLSSSPSLTNPSIIDELHLKVDGLNVPVNFTMNLPLDKIDINAVYYFLVQYVVRDNILIPCSQAFAFSPRNEATVVLTLSKTPQIPIIGQVTSTGSPLILPTGSTLHLYITDNFDQIKPMIYSEVFLQASSNSLYEFTMNIDSLILQKKIPLYLHADILYEDRVILSIPRPALLQISPGGEWNINLVIDLPTLLIGQIVSMSQQQAIGGEFDVHIQILERGTTNIIDTSRIRLSANLPQPFRIELDNDLFARYPSLQVRAVIKNCKEQVLFESGGTVNIHPGLNIKVDLPVVLTDRKKFSELQTTINEIAPLRTGIWRLSVTGVVSDLKYGRRPAVQN